MRPQRNRSDEPGLLLEHRATRRPVQSGAPMRFADADPEETRTCQSVPQCLVLTWAGGLDQAKSVLAHPPFEYLAGESTHIGDDFVFSEIHQSSRGSVVAVGL